jgi:hypothetical protein
MYVIKAAYTMTRIRVCEVLEVLCAVPDARKRASVVGYSPEDK